MFPEVVVPPLLPREAAVLAVLAPVEFGPADGTPEVGACVEGGAGALTNGGTGDFLGTTSL